MNNICDTVLSNLVATRKLDITPTFRTNLEIIQRVMNVPMEAVKSIARGAGIQNTDDTQSACIDEDALCKYADSFLRKTKYYFKNASSNIDRLAPDEWSTYDQFCRTYKKAGVKTAKALSWDDINQELIREEFIAEIKKQSEELSPLNRIAAAIIEAHDSIVNTHSKEDNVWLAVNHDAFPGFGDILKSITNSRYYHAGRRIQKNRLNLRNRYLEVMLISARYHICGDSGKEEDHHIVTVRDFRNLIINSTLMMAS